MRFLSLMAMAGLAVAQALLPPQAPDLSLLYALPLLVWAREGRPRAVDIVPVLSAALLLTGQRIHRSAVPPGEWVLAGWFALNLLACAGIRVLWGWKDGEAPRKGAAPLPAALEAATGGDSDWRASSPESPLLALSGAPESTPVGTPGPSRRRPGLTPRSGTSSEAVLRRIVARLRFALEGSNTGVWEWDLTTNRNHYSTVWRSMLGYGPNEIENTQAAWVALIHPDDLALCEDSIQRHLNGETLMHKAEHRLRARDGSWRWVLTQGRILRRDSEGRPLRMLGTHTDISATKQLTAELSAEKNRLELALKAGNFGVWEFNFFSGEVTWDRRMHEALGLSAGTFGGTQEDWLKIMHPDDRDAVFQDWQRQVEDTRQNAYEGEFRSLHGRTGEYRLMRLIGTIVRGPDLVPSHAIGLHWDVTEEKRAAEILLKAKEAAEAGEKARSDFMASISHELRTPMNSVLGMAQLLLQAPLNPAHREMVAIMHRSGETLLNIINDILDFSRMEAGQLRMHPAPFLLSDVIRDTSRLLEFQASRKGIRLQCGAGAGLGRHLLGDAGRIQQIVTNLVGNAIKFTERGTVCFSIRLLEETGEKLRFRLEVRDSGIGIPARLQSKLFSPFQQLDQSSLRQFGGTGLGLAISNQIAAALGSRIEFESAEEQGSTFWLDLELPLCRARTGPAESEPEGLEAGWSGEAPTFRSLRLLLVEDDEANQLVATLMLQQFGHRVAVAGNGQVALEMLAREAFDGILMDCRMPVLDGFETTRRIRAGETAAVNLGIPIIALTASGMPGDQERCLAIGMSGFALKPLHQGELEKVFRRCGLRLTAPRGLTPAAGASVDPSPDPRQQISPAAAGGLRKTA